MQHEPHKQIPKLLAHQVASMIGRHTLVPRSPARKPNVRGWRVAQVSDYEVMVYWHADPKSPRAYGADDVLAWREVVRAIEQVQDETTRQYVLGKGHRRIRVGERRSEIGLWSLMIESNQFMPKPEDRRWAKEEDEVLSQLVGNG